MSRQAALRLYAERVVRLEILLEACGGTCGAVQDEIRLVRSSERQTGGVREDERDLARTAVRCHCREFGASEEAEKKALRRLFDVAVH